MALYVRISHDPLNLRAGVIRQLEDCATLAARCFPEEPTRIYEDNDTSAWSGAARTAYQELLLAIARGQVSALCAYDLDRLFRHPRDLEAFLDLCATKHLTNVITCSGDIDLSSHDGQLHARILAAVAKKESDDKSRRISRASQARIAAGLYPGGKPPFGFRTGDTPGTLEPLPGASTSLSWAIKAVIGGATMSSVYRDMPAFSDGTRPRSRTTLRKALLSPSIAGLTSDLTPATWWPLVEPALWHRAHAILSDPARSLGGYQAIHRPRAHWLSSILYCPTCDQYIVAQTFSSGAVRYVCRGCWRGIDAAKTEDHISRMLFAVVVLHAPEPTDDTHDQRRELEARLNLLADVFASGDITHDEWQVARRRVTSLIDALPVSPSTVQIPTSLASTWPTLDAARKHAVASQLLERVELASSCRAKFDASRLFPVWRT